METAEWLKAHHPSIKVLALSMNSDDMSVIRMLKAGARGFVLKGAETSELLRAISDVETNGFFFSDFISDKLIWAAQGPDAAKVSHPTQIITVREQEFLQLACSEMTYKEIADKMHVSARTVDGYRESLFDKLGLKSRVGLVLFSIRNRLVEY
jgi:DNA-binding NarL/FixJ family response regulator